MQDVIARRHAGDVNVLAGQSGGIDIGPAGLDSLVSTIILHARICSGGPGADVFEAKADFVAGRDDVAIGIEQIVLGELFKVIMLMTGSPAEEGIGCGIAHHQIAGADVARLGGEAQQHMSARGLASFDDFAVVAVERLGEDRGRGRRPPNDQVRQGCPQLIPVQHHHP